MPASLFDVNVWVAATFPPHPLHARAVAALEAATENEPAAFCRATENSFLRLVTTPQLTRHYKAGNLTNQDAVSSLHLLLSRRTVTEVAEAPGTAALWYHLAGVDRAAPKVWMDAYLAAFAITGGLRFVTLDHDFEGYVAHGLDLNLLNP